MTEVGKLKKEIEELKAMLAAGGGGVSDAQQAQMQAQIDDYNLMLKQSFEEKAKLAREMEQAQHLLCSLILLLLYS